MERQILDLGSERCVLKKNRGSLLIETENGDIPIAFDEIEAIIVHAHAATYSNPVFLELSERGIPLVGCDPAHQPTFWVWPMKGHHEQSRRMAAQVGVRPALKRQLWTVLVKAKIAGQAEVILEQGGRHKGVLGMTRSVRSGDPDNVEAQAAARYFELAFGKGFRRLPQSGGLNAVLNYGYAILRSCMARYICAAGLHPSLGLHHHNRFDHFCLVDDAMEPFRPQVDKAVIALRQRGVEEVNREAKEALAAVLAQEVELADGFTPLSRAVERLAQSLATSIVNGRVDLVLPLPKAFF